MTTKLICVRCGAVRLYDFNWVNPPVIDGWKYTPEFGVGDKGVPNALCPKCQTPPDTDKAANPAN